MGTNYFPGLEERLRPSIAIQRRLARAIAQSLRVMLPAVVETFYPGPPATVDVNIPMLEWIFQDTSSGDSPISVQAQPTAISKLVDVPVQFVSGGAWNITVPIQQGDECMVVFSDRQLDWWWQNGGANAQLPTSQRTHSLSDGIAIFGLRSKPRGLANYSTTSMQIRNDDGSVVIDLTDSQVTITAPKVVVNTSGDTDVNASGNVNLTATGTVTLASGGSNHTVIDGLQVAPHYHGNVQPGSGFTGPMVG